MKTVTVLSAYKKAIFVLGYRRCEYGDRPEPEADKEIQRLARQAQAFEQRLLRDIGPFPGKCACNRLPCDCLLWTAKNSPREEKEHARRNRPLTAPKPERQT